tara:strand:- start:56 stop:763 length:708 start_codon:yes stop_codon:yes gene_type:complete
MAISFLENQKCIDEILDVIEKARSELIIITPYIDLDERWKSSFRIAQSHGVKMKLITRWKKKLAAKDEKDLQFFTDVGAEIKFVVRLHSKLYLNENSAVMSSMNLLDGSSKRSEEIGIFTTEKDLLSSFRNYSERLERSAMPEESKPAKSTAKAAPSQKKKESMMGFCIRTGERIPFDLKKPFSDKAFKSWNRFKNPEFIEKYCHFSGEEPPGGTSFGKPILRQHWSAAKKKHGL